VSPEKFGGCRFGHPPSPVLFTHAAPGGARAAARPRAPKGRTLACELASRHGKATGIGPLDHGIGWPYGRLRRPCRVLLGGDSEATRRSSSDTGAVSAARRALMASQCRSAVRILRICSGVRMRLRVGGCGSMSALRGQATCPFRLSDARFGEGSRPPSATQRADARADSGGGTRYNAIVYFGRR
jgi:hypothetical protein